MCCCACYINRTWDKGTSFVLVIDLNLDWRTRVGRNTEEEFESP